jgi:hypothetical protein
MLRNRGVEKAGYEDGTIAYLVHEAGTARWAIGPELEGAGPGSRSSS